jgi:hypothetical protein
MADGTPNNLALWQAVATTDPKYTKAFKRGGGFSGTAINSTYLVRRATERFGPCGIGWGYTIVSEEFRDVPLPLGFVIHILQLELWYKLNTKDGLEVGRVRHFGQTTFVGKNQYGLFVDEEAPKKSLTDALKKCLTMLGFAGDVHLGLYDDDKYVNLVTQQFAEMPAGADRNETMDAAEKAGVISTPDGAVTGPDAIRRKVDSSRAGTKLRGCKSIEAFQELVESEKYQSWRDGLAPEHKDALLQLQNERWAALQALQEGPPEDQEALIAEIGDRYAETRTLAELDDVTDAFSDRVDGLSMPNRERIVDLHGKNQRRILAAAADAEQAKSADKAAVQEPYTELEFPSQESYRYIILSRIANVSDPAGAQDLKDLWNQTKAQRKKLGITGAKSRELAAAIAEVLVEHNVATRIAPARSPTQH